MDSPHEKKNQGNLLYKQNKYHDAIQVYNQALHLIPLEIQTLNSNPSAESTQQLSELKILASIVHCNISACYYNLGKYEKSEESATRSLDWNSEYTKALYRRYQAKRKLNKLPEAWQDLRILMKLQPQDQSLQKEATETIALLNQSSQFSGARGLLNKLKDELTELQKTVRNYQTDKHETDKAEDEHTLSFLNDIKGKLISIRQFSFDEDHILELIHLGIFDVIFDLVKSFESFKAKLIPKEEVETQEQEGKNPGEQKIVLLFELESLCFNIISKIVKPSNLSPEPTMRPIHILVNKVVEEGFGLNLLCQTLSFLQSSSELFDFPLTYTLTSSIVTILSTYISVQSSQYEQLRQSIAKKRTERAEERRNKKTSDLSKEEEEEEKKQEEDVRTKENEEEAQRKAHLEQLEERIVKTFVRILSFKTKYNKNHSDKDDRSQSGEENEKIQCLGLHALVTFPYSYATASNFISNHFHQLLTLAANREHEHVRNLSSVAMSQILDKSNSYKEEMKKTVKKSISLFVQPLLESTNVHDLISAFKLYSSILLADNNLGVEILIENIAKIMDVLEVFTEELRDLGRTDLLEQLQYASSEIFAHAAIHEKFRNNMKSTEQVQGMIGLLKSTKNLETKAHVLVALSKLSPGSTEVKDTLLKDGGEMVYRAVADLVEFGNREKPKQADTENNDNQLTIYNEEIRRQKMAILNSKEQKTLIQWAIEALSFLTMLPEIKEKVSKDSVLLSSLFALCRSTTFDDRPSTNKNDPIPSPSSSYGLRNFDDGDQPQNTSTTNQPNLNSAADREREKIKMISEGKQMWRVGFCSILMNLTTNPKLLISKEQLEIQEQLQKLHSFAGMQRAPTIHALDSESHVEKRCLRLIESGILGVLSQITRELDAKYTSENTREILSVLYLNISQFTELRGKMVQEGAIKSLVALFNADNTSKGYLASAQAIAKISISTNPHIVYSNQSELQVVGPLMKLLESEEPLHQFESLMALTNLATLSEDTREYIIRGKGLSAIEMRQLSDNEMVRRAACELLCNLLHCNTLWDMYHTEKGVSKIRLWVFLCNSEEFETIRACSGALAILSESDTIAQTIFEEMDWRTIQELCWDESEEVKHRVSAILKNLLRLKDAVPRLKALKTARFNMSNEQLTEETPAFQLDLNHLVQGLEQSKAKPVHENLKIIKAQLAL